MSVWNNLGSGSWSVAGNWIGGVPDGLGAVADFSNLAGASIFHVIDLSVMGPWKVGTLKLKSSATENYGLTNGRLVMMSLNQNTPAQIDMDVAAPGNTINSYLGSSLILQLNTNTNVVTTGVGATLSIYGNITGIGSLNKFGTGLLLLSGPANDYIGGTVLAGGTTEIFNGGVFGSGALTFSQSSTLFANGITISLANDIMINAGGSPTIKAFTGTTLTLTGKFDAQGGAGTVLHIGSVSDTGTVVFGTSIGSVDPLGSLSIDGGIFQDGTGGNLSVLTANLASTNIASGAVLDLHGHDLTVKNLTGSGLVVNSNIIPWTFTVVETANTVSLLQNFRFFGAADFLGQPG